MDDNQTVNARHGRDLHPAMTTDEQHSQRAVSSDLDQRTIYSILLVEDDSTLATLVASTLSAYGYRVFAVASGAQALTTLTSFTPDLVVLDLELDDGMTGWTVLQSLRLLAHMPVLVTTSSQTPVRTYLRSRGEPRSTLDYLPKPYTVPTLIKRIQRMIAFSS